jgi:hypothetical protein
MYQLDSEGFIRQRRLPDKRRLIVEPFGFGRARLGISMLPPLHEVGVYAGTWEFPSIASALLALETWEPEQQKEPDGWDRHADTMRYRIGGDPTLEYVKCDGDIEQSVQCAIYTIVGQDCGIVAVIDRSNILRLPFPEGSWFFEVLTKQAEYSVYCYLDRCVVLSEEEKRNVSVGTVIKRLTG